MFSLPSSGGGAPLLGPGWDQEHPPSGFAIQAKGKRKRAAARIVKEYIEPTPKVEAKRKFDGFTNVDGQSFHSRALSGTTEAERRDITTRWDSFWKGMSASSPFQGPSLPMIGRMEARRAPRPVLDNTVCGLNPRCLVPERSTLPTCKDILRTFPIREFQGDHMGFSVDVKAAHKRIVLHDQEQGLGGFTLDGHTVWCGFFCPLVGETWWLPSSHLPSDPLVGAFFTLTIISLHSVGI